jgi:hypothetical protein
MRSGIGGLVSFGVGVVIALLAVIGGVSALTGAANSQEASANVVTYDAK